MAVFTSNDILRFLNKGEDDFVIDYPCIIERIGLSIVAGTSVYQLSDSVQSIRRITWQGIRIDPISHRNLRDSGLSGIQTGKPYSYIYDNVGQSKIQFFPVPTVNIAVSGSNLFGAAISTDVIAEYYRIPDHSTLKIPSFFRRRLLKCYVNKMCFAMEGKGQNLKASKYWADKWNYLKEYYGLFLDELINSPRRIIMGKSVKSEFLLPRPQLPYNKQGIGVNKGE